MGSTGTGLGSSAPIAAAALVAYGVELVVVGGCALVIRGGAEQCSDLDVVPEPSVANLARLCSALDAIGARRPSAKAIAERQLTSMTSPYGRIDVMVATARREFGALATAASECSVAGVPVPVAATADVLRLRAEFWGHEFQGSDDDQ
jgi:hypothetical protein